MPGDLVQLAALRQMRVDIRHHGTHGISSVRVAPHTKNSTVRRAKDVTWRVISAAPDHHAVQSSVQEPLGLIKRGYPAVHRNMQIGKQPLHAVHDVIIKRRNIAVFLRRQPLQPRLAGMNCHAGTPRANHMRQKLRQDHLRVLIIHADAAFHRHLNLHRRTHRRQAARNQRRMFQPTLRLISS